MIGLGPHTMTTTAWVVIAVVQVGLILLTVFAVWLAVRMTRSGG